MPPGGTCLSAFVIVSTGTSILVGKMTKPEVWVENFFVGPNFVAGYVDSGKFVLPARHLAWYESPLDAADSILKQQLGLPIPRSQLVLVDVQSHIRGEVGSKEKPAHWDLCFIFTVKLKKDQLQKLKQPTWFKSLEFRPKSALRTGDFTRGHGDILEEAGMIRTAK